MGWRIYRGDDRADGFQQIWADGERGLYRGQRIDETGNVGNVLFLRLTTDRPRRVSVDRLAHEYELRHELQSAWAIRPLDLVYEGDQPILVLEDPGGEPLVAHLGEPMETLQFLRLAISIVIALGQVHRRSLIHKDLKPVHILVDRESRHVRLTGFGLASRMPRERSSDPPEVVAGTLAYMAPEQTGRINRSIDSRSDLYALGVIYYQMLAGALPFITLDPREWIYFHIAQMPTPLHERLSTIPPTVSHIVMKLLSKVAEDRYQTTAGVEHDLRRCAAEWQTLRRITIFPVGEADSPDRLLIPEKLYGREEEVASLLEAYNRVATTGAAELILVSGYSGVGKSSVVNEIRKGLAPTRGLFAAGKFDQLTRDIPYGPVAQAFRGLLKTLLSESDAELARWGNVLREALGSQGRPLAELMPELKLIIGELPPTPDLPAQQNRRLFQVAFQRFIGVFAAPEHPLALFLDDLQWVDTASLDLLQEMMTRSNQRHLLVIGAYRDNELNSHHPLVRTLEAIRASDARVGDVVLTPLGQEHLEEFVAEATRCLRETAAPLSQVLFEKTAGNPFFSIQFLLTLADEGLIVRDPSARQWSWRLDQIRSKGYTENVAELMAGKLGQLPKATRAALAKLACLGNAATFEVLSHVLSAREDRMHAILRAAVRHNLIERRGDVYAFIHDRVQEAAYATIPSDQRAKAHLRIGRLLVLKTPPEQRQEAVFEIVNQLNLGATLIDLVQEREQLVELNLIAGKRARASAAYLPALKYFTTGASLLTEDPWTNRHETAFAIEVNRAESEILTGDVTAAEQRLTALLARADTAAELAAVASIRIDLYTTLDLCDQAVGACVDYLRRIGMDLPESPSREDARREYEQIWTKLGARNIEELIELPLMQDAASLGTLDVLTRVFPSALFTNENLLSFAVCRAINLSVDRGHADASCVAYAFFGKIAGPVFDDFQAGVRFGRLGYDLVERRGLERLQARTYLWFSQFSMMWTEHVQASRPVIRRAYEIATKVGDVPSAVYSFDHMNTNLLAAGDPLGEAQLQAEEGLKHAERAQFGHMSDIIRVQLAVIRSLRGLTRQFGSFDDEFITEAQLERRYAENPLAKQPECWYWIRKLQVRFFAGEYSSALDAANRAAELLGTSAAMFETAEYHFYAALTLAACCDPMSPSRRVSISPSSEWSREAPPHFVRMASESANPVKRQEHLDAIATHLQQLEIWAGNCPANFENRAALVGAEVARLNEDYLKAQELYERAIDSARVNRFVHNEALAYEVAARFYAARGFDEIATLYLRNARHCYSRWGADGKVRQLDASNPQLAVAEAAPAATSTIFESLKGLDLATIIKISQTVSGEIVSDKLIATLMHLAIEHAGAERGILILPRGDEQRVEAEASIERETVVVRQMDPRLTESRFPEAIVNYVARTRECVIVDDAHTQTLFSGDAYLDQQRTRSILCLPLTKQGSLVGVLYLENGLASHVFTPGRVALLELLASQAAISLENTRLYSELEEREAKIRRLVDANILGIFIWSVGGKIIEANEAFLQMVGYRSEDLRSGRLRWADLWPPEWEDSGESVRTALMAGASKMPSETEFMRRDGARLPVLVGSADFGGRGGAGVAFVVDLTERNRAQTKALETERRYQQVQVELEHANRVATMGHLSASIAHEVNQPIAAAVTNVHTAMRWLSAKPPNIEKAKQALGRILENANRAGDVIEGIRALIKKEPPRYDNIAMNETVSEVMGLVHGEILKNDISLRMKLSDGLSVVKGNKVQLQQVILNFVINALQAMTHNPEGVRELVVTTAQTASDGVIVAVADSGIGLAPSDYERIFEAFFTTKPSGLGMGLPICRSIVEAHGGRLWATANAPRGAIFQFALPVFAEGDV